MCVRERWKREEGKCVRNAAQFYAECWDYHRVIFHSLQARHPRATVRNSDEQYARKSRNNHGGAQKGECKA